MKLNPKEIANKALGAVAGTIAGGMANKAVSRFMPTASPIIRGLALIALGAVAPGMLGKSAAKGGLLDYAGAAVIGQGATTILQTVAPGLIAGADEYVMGISDGLDAAEEIVNGSDEMDYNNPVADNVGQQYTL